MWPSSRSLYELRRWALDTVLDTLSLSVRLSNTGPEARPVERKTQCDGLEENSLR